MGILVLIYLTRVTSDRCPFDEMQVFPSPPEFPDFMTAFEGTILRIGLMNLLPNDDGPTLSKSCPESVNWSEFNSRLCGNDPFDLEGFCNPTTTAEPTVASLTTAQMPVVRSNSIATTTETTYDLGNNTTSSTVNITSVYPGFNHTNDTDLISRTFQPPDHKDSDDSSFKDHTSKDAESDYDATKDTDSKDPILPPDVYAVNGSKGVAAALYQGGGASIAIGVGCGMTLLCFLVIVIIIVLSHPASLSEADKRRPSPYVVVTQPTTVDTA